MARPWRIEYGGALYHVFSRGNNQQDIFITDDDRYLFLDTIGQMSERFDTDIFAYVLMGNHYHLLLRTQKANLSRSMQWFGTTYTRRFNLDHFQSGHLFQGRYKSILVENDAYLMQLSYQQIGELFGLTHSSVSRRVTIIRKKVTLEQNFLRQIETIKSQIKP